MIDPFKIEFEDDIVLVLKSFIKRMKAVSPTLWQIFPYLMKVFEKNKKAFGNLLDAINYYLLYGKEYLAANTPHLDMIVQMANLSLFGKEPNITI
jgi:hypothetical protein